MSNDMKRNDFDDDERAYRQAAEARRQRRLKKRRHERNMRILFITILVVIIAAAAAAAVFSHQRPFRLRRGQHTGCACAGDRPGRRFRPDYNGSAGPDRTGHGGAGTGYGSPDGKTRATCWPRRKPWPSAMIMRAPSPCCRAYPVMNPIPLLPRLLPSTRRIWTAACRWIRSPCPTFLPLSHQ